MINGSNDDSVPAELSVSFYDEFKEHYRAEIECVVEDEYYFVSDDMIRRTKEWLMKFISKE